MGNEKSKSTTSRGRYLRGTNSVFKTGTFLCGWRKRLSDHCNLNSSSKNVFKVRTSIDLTNLKIRFKQKDIFMYVHGILYTCLYVWIYALTWVRVKLDW